MEFDRIDINQCPPGLGNSGPNRFADTARCKKETTEVLFLFLKENICYQKYLFSVSQYMAGALEEVDINAGVSRVTDYLYKFVGRFWVKLLKEQQLNSITMRLIA